MKSRWIKKKIEPTSVYILACVHFCNLHLQDLSDSILCTQCCAMFRHTKYIYAFPMYVQTVSFFLFFSLFLLSLPISQRHMYESRKWTRIRKEVKANKRGKKQIEIYRKQITESKCNVITINYCKQLLSQPQKKKKADAKFFYLSVGILFLFIFFFCVYVPW